MPREKGRKVVASNRKARHDYTILDTRGVALTYSPERLSMERSATVFSAGDRIGQLQVQLNDIADSRRMLEAQKVLRHAAPLELEP